MPLRAGGINFHFPYEDAPRERREVRPQPCPGWEPPQGQLLPVHTHVCSRMRVHMHVLHERAHTHTHVCVCKHMHMNACKHRLQTYSHRCLHMCVTAIQACNTGLQYRRAFACACNCLHMLATICTRFQCMHVFAQLHACTSNMCMLTTHGCAFLHTHALQHVHAHACTVAHSCNTCTLAHTCNTCMCMLTYTCNTRMSAHLHTLHRMHMHGAHTRVAAPPRVPSPPQLVVAA